MTTELLSNELRAATSDEAAACRDDTRKNLGFGRQAEESANRTANSRRGSALAGCAVVAEGDRDGTSISERWC